MENALSANVASEPIVRFNLFGSEYPGGLDVREQVHGLELALQRADVSRHAPCCTGRRVSLGSPASLPEDRVLSPL